MKERKPQPQKPSWKSWTFVVNLLIIILGFWPDVKEFLADYAGTDQFTVAAAQVIALVNIGLRFKTKGPIGGSLYVMGQGGKKALNILPGVNLK